MTTAPSRPIDQQASAHVLVIHHEPETRSLLTQYLQAGDYQVSAVEDWDTALGSLQQRMADVLILDLAMVQQAEGDRLGSLFAQYPTLRLVVIGDGCSLEDAIGAMKQGAMDFIDEPPGYLQRPLEADRIQAVVAEVLQRPLPSPEVSVDYDELIQRAQQWAQNSDFHRAREIIREALKQAPNRPEGLTLLGQITEYLGEHNEALKYYRAAIGLDPTYAVAKQNLDRAVMHPRTRPNFDQ